MAVLEQHRSLGAERERDEPAAVADQVVLEPVDDEQVGLDVDDASGRCVQAEERRLRGRGQDGSVGDLELAEDGVGLPHVDRLDARVRSRRDHDLVLAVGCDEHQRDAGWSSDGLDVEVDARSAQPDERLVGEGIATDAADEPHVRPQACRGNCLVRALAAREPLELGAAERLAGPRQPLDARDEIEVDRADDGDPRRHAPSVTSGRCERAQVFERLPEQVLAQVEESRPEGADVDRRLNPSRRR